MNDIMTAKQMKALAKAKNKERKLAKKRLKESETVNPEVVKEIIDDIKNSDRLLEDRWMLIYGKEYEVIIRELYNNFDAYKEFFRKLGYKLRYQSDCYGYGFSISF